MRSSETAEARRSAEKVINLSPCITCPVRGASVCSALGRQDLHRLTALAKPLEFERRATIFCEGDPAQFLFVVTEGLVKVFKLLADGRRQTTGFYYPGDFLGLAYRDRHAYTAEAVTTTQVCRIGRQDLQTLSEELPDLQQRLLLHTSNALASAQDQILLLGRKKALERIATFLLIYLRRAEYRGDESGRIELGMKRSDISDYLGVALETISREFQKLARNGVIALPNNHEVIVLDRVALADIAGCDAAAPTTALSAAE